MVRYPSDVWGMSVGIKKVQQGSIRREEKEKRRERETEKDWKSMAFRIIYVTGQTKSGSQAHHEQKNIKDRYVARIGVTGAPPWSQAWGWGSQASAWWPGLCPRDPAGLSLKW
ncbi:hypothetical protein L3Q82_020695 [Scortum barcoo]|uniref:Uncharacterized protein n=1 Tax=Scortum barcoo TaxID=214431 RepID=A0ACB8V8L6_9TELE|nr:hypothetical protein L3Q82_020695 [Scortum barcoo]